VNKICLIHKWKYDTRRARTCIKKNCGINQIWVAGTSESLSLFSGWKKVSALEYEEKVKQQKEEDIEREDRKRLDEYFEQIEYNDD
jgi:hypothetical protein